MNYYEELSVGRSASADEIRRSYKRLARLLHPDRCAEDPARVLAELQMKRRGLKSIADLDLQLLAVSGGGEDGAFGAGLLCGWSQQGSRPVFEVVTGVSTGALIAPFAYLGPAYDDKLRYVYTEISAESVLRKRSPLAALFARRSFHSGRKAANPAASLTTATRTGTAP